MLRLHLALVLSVPPFIALGIWQLRRALNGNTLSWAYTFEWPLFAGYAIYMWWKLTGEERGTARSRPDADEADPASASAAEAEAAEKLAAYNAFLAELRASDEQRRH